MLFGKTREQVSLTVGELGAPGYVTDQLLGWMYRKHAVSFQAMTNISAALREKLSSTCELGAVPPSAVSASADGTRKYLYGTPSGLFVEAAYIPEKERATLCVSSQAGCRMGCVFCMTGRQGFQGNLGSGEILNQYRSLPERDTVTNFVYMGMGEPMDNLEAVLDSVTVLTAPWGYAMSPRRITVSTVGVLPAMREFLLRSQAHLAVSLHTPFDDERRRLMPVQNAHPVRDVIAELKRHDFGGQRRVSFEYILFGGLNDTPRHANELVRLLNGLRCRVNLIRFHAIPGTSLRATDETALSAFREHLTAKGILTTIRASRGQDIGAACGLLSTRSSGAP